MKYGLKVPAKNANSVSDFCEKNKIEFSIWNIEDYFIGNAKIVDFEFDTKEDCNKADDYLEKEIQRENQLEARLRPAP